MSLDTALISLGKYPKIGSLRFAEPTCWEDRYEGRFYNAVYSNTSGSLSGKKPDPVVFGCCFTTKQDNEAAWKIYTYGKTGLGSICVEFKINKYKLRSALVKGCILGSNMYVGMVNYLPQDIIDTLHKPNLNSNHHRVINPDYSKFFSRFTIYNYINLLLLKRDAFDHEKEMRYFIKPPIIGDKSYVNKKNVFVQKNSPIDVPIDWIPLIEEVRIDSKCSDLEYSLLEDRINDWINHSPSIVDKSQMIKQLKPIRYNVYGIPEKIKIDIP